MKKTVTTIVSLALAGTMALGLAACDKTEGNGALSNAIDATLAAKNYSLAVKTGIYTNFYYKGQPLKADTVISTDEGEVTGSALLVDLEIISTADDFANPVYENQGEDYFDCDYAGGKTKMTMVNNGEEQISYAEIDGTTLTNYYMNEKYEWDDETFEPKISYVPASSAFTGFVSAEQAKTVLKNNVIQSIDGINLENMLDVKVKGTGKNAQKEGNIKELVDLFEYNANTKTYTVTVDASALGGVMYTNCEVAITVENGKISYLAMTVPADEYVSSLLEGVPEGITAEATMVASSEYSNYGSVTVTVPAEAKNVDAEDAREMPILTSEEVWKKLLADFGTAEFKITSSGMKVENDVAAYIYTNIYVDTIAKVAALDRMNYTTYTPSLTYYKAADGKLSTYIGQFGFFLTGYSEPTVTDISGDETAALIAALPEYAQDYYAGFSGGVLKDQFSKFELYSVYSYTANLKLNGKEVKVVVSYGYDGEEYSLDEVEVYYNSSEHFSVSANAKDELEEYSPDNF